MRLKGSLRKRDALQQIARDTPTVIGDHNFLRAMKRQTTKVPWYEDFNLSDKRVYIDVFIYIKYTI